MMRRMRIRNFHISPRAEPAELATVQLGTHDANATSNGNGGEDIIPHFFKKNAHVLFG